MVVKYTKIYQKMKKKRKLWLSIEKISQSKEKSFTKIIGNHFRLENSVFSDKRKDFFLGFG